MTTQAKNKYLPQVLDLTPSVNEASGLMVMKSDGPFPIINYSDQDLTTVSYFRLLARIKPTKAEMTNPYESKASIPTIKYQGEKASKNLSPYSLGYSWDQRLLDDGGLYPVNIRIQEAAETLVDVYAQFEDDLQALVNDNTIYGTHTYAVLNANRWNLNTNDPLTQGTAAAPSGIAPILTLMSLIRAPITDIVFGVTAWDSLIRNTLVGQRCAGGAAGSPPIPTANQIIDQLKLLNGMKPLKIWVWDSAIAKGPIAPGAHTAAYTQMFDDSVLYLSNGMSARALADSPPTLSGKLATLPRVASPFVGVLGNLVIDHRDRSDTWSEGEDVSLNGGMLNIAAEALAFLQQDVTH